MTAPSPSARITGPLLLASASPRRAEILRDLGFELEVRPANVPEAPAPGETPEAYAERLAREKAEAVAAGAPGRWVVGGDTVVVCEGRILEKPADAEDAVRMLLALQGRTHRVISGLALVGPAPGPAPGQGTSGSAQSRAPNAPARTRSGIELTRVTFRPFDRAFAEGYVATGEPMDKAGAYAIQGKGAALVTRIEGDYSNVVGLPIPLLLRLLDEAGVGWGW